MSQLTANAFPVFESIDINNLPVAASTTIYAGSAVGDNGSGYARQLVAGDPFRGFALGLVNNNANTSGIAIGVPSTSGAAGALSVAVQYAGRIVAAITGAAVTDVGRSVYMSDGATFTYTATGNTLVGKVHRFVSSTQIIVFFNASTPPVSTGISITDITGGTASTTFAAITAGATYSQADMVAVKNALAQIAVSLNTASK